MKMWHKFYLSLFLSLILIVIFGNKAEAALTGSFQVFPTNSRLSFRGKLATGNVIGTSLAVIKTTPDADENIFSVSAGQLMNNDAISIGDVDYKVATISSVLRDSEIPLSDVLTATNVAEDTEVIMAASGPIKIEVTTSAVNPGDTFSFYLQSATVSASTVANDGLPDPDGFDFNSVAAIVCPTNYTASAGVPATDDYNYHRFTCTYTGAAVTNQSLTFYINDLLNPTPEAGKDVKAMGIMAVLFEQESSTGEQLYFNNNFVGFANSVKMTVRVAPQLTFKIEGIANNVTACNKTTTTSTTGTLVPFGSISNLQLSNAAQKLTVTTNAANGYVITAIASDQMNLINLGCPGDGVGNDACIPGFSTPGTASAWDAVETAGAFGFSMEVVSGDTYLNGSVPNVTPAFTWNGSNAIATGWSSFADKSAGAAPVQIINNLRSTNGDEVNVCYQINSATTNVPGQYQTSVTYTITASF